CSAASGGPWPASAGVVAGTVSLAPSFTATLLGRSDRLHPAAGRHRTQGDAPRPDGRGATTNEAGPPLDRAGLLPQRLVEFLVTLLLQREPDGGASREQQGEQALLAALLLGLQIVDAIRSVGLQLLALLLRLLAQLVRLLLELVHLL